MPCPHSKGKRKHRSGRKHTPITSKKQRGLFGAEYARRKRGQKGRMSGITTAELRSHLKESKGKRLPAKSKRRRRGARARLRATVKGWRK